MDFEADELDELLGEAMRSRPEVQVREGVDLAVVAIARAQAANARMTYLTQMGRRLRWCSLAAGLLVALVLAGGVYLYPASGDSGTTSTGTEVVDAGSAQTSSSAGEVTGSSSSSTVDWMTLGMAALALAAVGVAVKAVMAPGRQGLRMAGA